MNRLLLGIGIASFIFASGVWIGYQVQSGKEAKKDIKIITKEVENHNEDLISLSEHNKRVKQIQGAYEKKLQNIPLIDSSADCPIGDHERMHNEAIRAANNVRFTN